MAPQPEYWNETCLAVGVSQRHIFVKGKDTTKEENYLKKKIKAKWKIFGKKLFSSFHCKLWERKYKFT